MRQTDYLTYKEAAEIARVSRQTICKWVKENQFKVYRINKKVVLIDARQFHSFIKSNAA